jgi:rhodanese-related sulfurtransferase
MFLTAFNVAPAFAQSEGSTVQSYENISVNTAHSMIMNSAFLNLVILDVRCQCEYDIGHLYGAILVPYDQLEARIGELEEYRNHEIIIYCRSGYRSQIACEILAEYNFTEVYNMVGGIIAWIEAGYPIWTTSHYVTVNFVDDEILLKIEPLLVRLSSCASCAQNQTYPSCSNPLNITSTVLEQRENFTKILVTYEVNGTERNITIAETMLWSYKESSDEANRTVTFIFTEFTVDDSSMQFYSLDYLVNSVNYNLTTHTTLLIVNTESYNGSFTFINYAPIENSEVKTLEFVEINSSLTLSQLYAVLGKAAKEIGKVYEKSEDASVMPLAQAYSRMNEEAKHLSKLVEKQLLQYNHKILHSSAIIMDMLTPGEDGGGAGPPPPPAGGCGIACCLVCEILCNAFLGEVCILVCIFTAGFACWICDFLATYPELGGIGCDLFCQYIGWC